MKTITIKKSNKWFFSCLFLFGSILTLNAQVQDSLTINSGSVASAIGLENKALGNYSFAGGKWCESAGTASFAFGTVSKAQGTASFALGQADTALGDMSIAIGHAVSTLTHESYAFGQNLRTRISQSIIIGTGYNSDLRLESNIQHSLIVGFHSTVPTFFVGPSSTYNGIGKVGIGTTDPKARFQVADGDIFIQDINKGIIMKSPDGNCWRGTMNNSGQLEFEKLTDCENLTTKSNEGSEINTIKVFPNPSKEYFEVKCSTSDCQKYNTISVYGTTGNLVFSQPFNSETTRISTSNFKSGSYVLKLHGGQESFTDIVVITH
jgi:hypothetical protein